MRFDIRGQEYEYHMSKHDAEKVNWMKKFGSGKQLAFAKKNAYDYKKAAELVKLARQILGVGKQASFYRMQRYPGRVDIYPESDSVLSLRTDIMGKYLEPNAFRKRFEQAVVDVNERAQKVALMLREKGYEANAETAVVSLSQDMMLVEARVPHERPEEHEHIVKLKSIIYDIENELDRLYNVRKV